MMVSAINLYELLKAKIGEQEAKTLVEYVEAKVEETVEAKKDTLLAHIGTLMAELETKIAQSEARLTLRMFYFWLGQVAVIGGLLAYFFNR